MDRQLLDPNQFVDHLFDCEKESLKAKEAVQVESTLDYPFDWGLGSSATTLLGFYLYMRINCNIRVSSMLFIYHDTTM